MGRWQQGCVANIVYNILKIKSFNQMSTANKNWQWIIITYEVRNGDPPQYAKNLDSVVLVIDY